MPNFRVTGSVPFFQKSIDGNAIKHGLSGKLKGTESNKRSKVVEQRGNVSIKMTGTKHKLNLTGIQHGAAKKSGTATTTPQTGQQTVHNAKVGITKPDFGPIKQDAPKPQLTPDEKFSAIGKRMETLRGELTEIRDLHQSARKEDVGSRKGASREVDLLEKQGAAQKEIEFLLGEVDNLVSAKPGSPGADDLVSRRKDLIALSVEVEFPQSTEMAGREISAGLKEASAKGGVLHHVLGNYDSTMLNRLLDPKHPAGLPGDVSGTRAKVLKDIDTALAGLSPFGQPLKGKERETENALREARSALELQGAFHDTVENVDRLRQREPGLTGGKFPVGRLLREFSHAQTGLHDKLSSTDMTKQAHGMEVIGALAGLFADSQVPAIFKTNDPTVNTLMAALKTDQCQTLAVGKFLNEIDHPVFEALVATHSKREGRPLTNAEIGKLVSSDAPELKKDFDEAMAKGKDAATARDLYFKQLGRVERVVGQKEIHKYQAAIWMKPGAPPQGTSRTEQKQQFEERLSKLGKDNPQAAFMVAGLAYLQHSMMKLDRDVLGLPYTENGEIDNFDIDRVLKTAGLSDKQMQKLGYDGAEARETRHNDMRKDAMLSNDPIKTIAVELEADSLKLGKRLLNLSKAGFSNPEQVRRHQNLFYHAANETLTNRSVQEMIGGMASQSTVTTARSMATDKMSEAIGLFTGTDVSASTKQTVKPTDSDVIEGFRLVASQAKRTIGIQPSRIDTLQEGAQTFMALDDHLGTLMTERGKIDKNIADARQILKTAAQVKDGPKIDVNPDKPAGLRSAKAILEALDLQAEIEAHNTGVNPLDSKALNDKTARRDQLLEGLKGLDPEMVRRPWYQKLRVSLGGGEAPSIESLKSLRQVATCIVYIRETSVEDKAKIDEAIGATAETRQDMLNQRMADNPEAMSTVKQMIRTAVLAHWPPDNRSLLVQGGNIQQAYEPAMHREAIEKTLKSWGIEPSEFAPEISDAVNSSLGAKDVQTWASESTKIDRETLLLAAPQTRFERFSETLRTELKEIFSKQGAKNAALFLVNKKIVDDQVKQELGALQRSLKDGDKIDFKSGYKLSVNTGKIPLEPSATLGIRGRLAMSALSNLVMERGSDGFKVTARFGGQVGLGVDLIADQSIPVDVPVVGVKVGGSLSGDLQVGGLGGFTETFPDTEAGREACSKFIMALANGERPDISTFEEMSDAASNKEFSSKGGVSAKGYAKAEITGQPFGNDGDPFSHETDNKKFKSGASNKLGVGANAGIEIAASMGGKCGVVQSFNKVTISTETESSIGITGSVNIYAKIPTGMSTAISAISNASGIQSKADETFHSEKDGKISGQMDAGGDIAASENLFLAELGSTLVSTTKMKLEYTKSDTPGVTDRLTKGELVRRSNLNYGSDNALIGAGNKQLKELLKTDEELKKNLEAIKKQVGGEDLLQVTYGLSAANLEKVADLLKLSDDIAETRPFEAAAIRGKVALFLQNEDNYEPTKITLLKKVASKESVNRGNAVLLKFDIIAEGTVESAEVVIKLTPKTKPSPELTL